MSALQHLVIKRCGQDKSEHDRQQIFTALRTCFEAELRDVSDDRLMRTGVDTDGWLLAVNRGSDELLGCLQIQGSKIANVCTMPEWRRRGVQARLLNEAIQEIEAAGHDASLWSVNKALVPFYQRFGFELTGAGLEMKRHRYFARRLCYNPLYTLSTCRRRRPIH